MPTVMEVTGTQSQVAGFARTITKQKLFLIRGKTQKNRSTAYVLESGMPHVESVAFRHNCKIRIYGEMPEHKEMPCGSFILPDMSMYHESSCNSCRSLAGKPPRGKKESKEEPKEAEVGMPEQLKTLEQDLGLDGVLQVMKERQTELLTMFDAYDSAIKALQQIQDRQVEFERLKAQVEADRQALASFMAPNGHPPFHQIVTKSLPEKVDSL